MHTQPIQDTTETKPVSKVVDINMIITGPKQTEFTCLVSILHYTDPYMLERGITCCHVYIHTLP